MHCIKSNSCGTPYQFIRCLAKTTVYWLTFLFRNHEELKFTYFASLVRNEHQIFLLPGCRLSHNFGASSQFIGRLRRLAPTYFECCLFTIQTFCRMANVQSAMFNVFSVRWVLEKTIILRSLNTHHTWSKNTEVKVWIGIPQITGKLQSNINGYETY